MTQTAPDPVVSEEAIALAGELNQQVVLLTRAMHVMRTQLATHAPEGVQWSTYVLLFHLAVGGPRRSGALAESVCVDPSTISRQIDHLVKLGLVERRADPADGRATMLAATAEGLELHRRMRARRDRVTAGLLTSWSPSDVRTLTHLLSRFTGDMAEQVPLLLSSIAGKTATETDKDDS